MAAKSTIEWTDVTWNPVRGCSVISPGCVNCYAMRQAHRFSGVGNAYEGLTKQTSAGPQWTGAVREVVSALNDPLKWKKPRRVFVNSMSDLFHDGVSDEFILNVFTVMAVAKHHTFQILTKRPERMLQLLSQWRADDIYTYWHGYSGEPAEIQSWPLPNVIVGVSVEDRKRADERFPAICELGESGWRTMVSMEPLLESVGVPARYLALRRLAWIVVGGESGHGARPFDINWPRAIVLQCKVTNVACFVKQFGSRPFMAEVLCVFDSYQQWVNKARFVACLEKKSNTPSAKDLEHWGQHQALFHNEHANGPWCWVLENIRRLSEPLECRGAQGLWLPPSWLVGRVQSMRLEPVA